MAALAALDLVKTRFGESRNQTAKPSDWSSHRGTLLHLGFVLALGLVTLAFNYSSTYALEVQPVHHELRPEVEIEVIRTATEEPEELPITLPEPEKQQFNPLADIELVEDVELAEELEFLEDQELVVPADAKISFKVPPPPKPAAPERPADPDLREIYRAVEQMPQFPGCADEFATRAEQQRCAEAKLMDFVYANFRVPDIATENGVSGTAVVTFVVERDGTVTGIEAVRDPGAGIGREAERVVEAMPPWQPGMQQGKPVRVQFNLPIKVRLE